MSTATKLLTSRHLFPNRLTDPPIPLHNVPMRFLHLLGLALGLALSASCIHAGRESVSNPSPLTPIVRN
jgi:hypothetical protein